MESLSNTDYQKWGVEEWRHYSKLNGLKQDHLTIKNGLCKLYMKIKFIIDNISSCLPVNPKPHTMCWQFPSLCRGFILKLWRRLTFAEVLERRGEPIVKDFTILFLLRSTYINYKIAALYSKKMIGNESKFNRKSIIRVEYIAEPNDLSFNNYTLNLWYFTVTFMFLRYPSVSIYKFLN